MNYVTGCISSDGILGPTFLVHTKPAILDAIQTLMDNNHVDGPEYDKCVEYFEDSDGCTYTIDGCTYFVGGLESLYDF